MSCKERLAILLKPYLDAKDIGKLCDCSKSKAYDLMKVIKAKYPDKLCFSGVQVRTKDFLDVFDLKLEDYIRNAELESKYLNTVEVQSWKGFITYYFPLTEISIISINVQLMLVKRFIVDMSVEKDFITTRFWRQNYD